MDLLDEVGLFFLMDEAEKEEWQDEYDPYDESGIDPFDYDSESEYEDAVKDSKDDWKYIYDCDNKYDIDPKDYDNEFEYEQAIEDAKDEKNDYSYLYYKNQDVKDDKDSKEDKNDKDDKDDKKDDYYDEYNEDDEYEEFYDVDDEIEDDEKLSWKDEYDSKDKSDLNPLDFENEYVYEDAIIDDLNSKKQQWQKIYDPHNKWDIDPTDYEYEKEYKDEINRLVKEEKSSWRFICDPYKKYNVNLDDYDTLEDYEKAIDKAKNKLSKKWKKKYDPKNDFYEDPDDYKTEKDYKDAIYNSKLKWRDYKDPLYKYDVEPINFKSFDAYCDAVDKAEDKEYKDKGKWRKIYDKKDEAIFIDPHDYETEEEYAIAVEQKKFENELEDFIIDRNEELSQNSKNKIRKKKRKKAKQQKEEEKEDTRTDEEKRADALKIKEKRAKKREKRLEKKKNELALKKEKLEKDKKEFEIQKDALAQKREYLLQKEENDYKNKKYKRIYRLAKKSWNEIGKAYFLCGINPFDYQNSEEYARVILYYKLNRETILSYDNLRTRKAYEIVNCHLFKKNDIRYQRSEFIVNNKDDILCARYLSPTNGFLFSQALKENYCFGSLGHIEKEDLEKNCYFKDIITSLDRRGIDILSVLKWCAFKFLPYKKYDNSCEYDIVSQLFSRYRENLYEVFKNDKEFFDLIINDLNTFCNFCGVVIGDAIGDKNYEIANKLFIKNFECAKGNESMIKSILFFCIQRLCKYKDVSNYDYFEKTYLPILKDSKIVGINSIIGSVQIKIKEYKQEINSTKEIKEDLKIQNKDLANNLINDFDEEFHFLCGVVVDETKKVYTYLADDVDVNIFDNVKVKSYTTNDDVVGKVVSFGKYSKDSIKMSINDIKSVNSVTKENCNFDFDENNKKIYNYCGVVFNWNNRVYDYICDDLDLNIKDEVIVLSAKGQKEVKVTVVSISKCSEAYTPYPVEKTKHILRKA